MKSIVFGDNFVSFSDSLYITVVSMSIVFFVLILICFFVSCMKFIPQGEEKTVEKSKKKETATVAAPKANTVETAAALTNINYEDERVRLAIMVASMEAAAENENAYIRVRSVREIV